MENILWHRKYPQIIPYIGSKYKEKRLLLILESHFLPDESKIHLDPKAWYEGDESLLSEEEKGWIYTKKTMRGHALSQPQNTAIPKVYKAIEETRLFSNSDTDKEDPFPYFALMNYFVRPAICGKGMERSYDKEEIWKHDVEPANERLEKVVEILKPKGVIFLSCFAYDCCNDSGGISKLKTRVGEDKVSRQYHPSSRDWDTKEKEEFQQCLRSFWNL